MSVLLLHELTNNVEESDSKGFNKTSAYWKKKEMSYTRVLQRNPLTAIKSFVHGGERRVSNAI